MATPILLPKQGNTVETCQLLEWKKKKGDHVNRGEIVCEVETDKAIFEIDSPEDGVLLELFFNVGDDIPVLTNIAVVGKPGEDYSALTPKTTGTIVKSQADVSAPEGDAAPKSEDRRLQKDKIITSGTQLTPSVEQAGISPRARKIAEQSGIDIQGIRGTGPGGRIIERDVLAAAASSEPLSFASRELVAKGAARPEEGTGIGHRVIVSDVRKLNETQAQISRDDDVEIVPLKGVRKLIADRMLHSIQHSAQLTLSTSAAAANLLEVRRNFKNNATYREFSPVTINDLVHYAVIRVLPHHPALNSLLQDEKIFYFKNIHLGFAVDTPRGLMVPVIKNSQKLGLLDLSREAKRLATQCINSKILADELAGGTFTVTNLGNFGIESFTPVLNLPQTAILGVNAIAPKPVESAKGIEFIPHISFSLTIDHRVIDGATGAKFLQDLSKAIATINLEAIGKTKTE
jgi:pyruvate dehydrogenase E2 component (dihydrolipoamide acetyltransferase)